MRINTVVTTPVMGADATVKQRRKQPRFEGGVGDVVSHIIEKIDSSKAVELVTTDVAGMVLPRTGIEYVQRGPDAGRETLVREIAGTVFNVFLVGWIGKAFTKYHNNRSARMNPLGLHTGAWINAKTLNVFGGLFEKAVKETASPLAARERFVELFLQRVAASDDYAMKVAADLVEGIDKATGDKIKERIKNAQELGKLSPESLQELKGMLAHSDTALSGTTNLETRIAAFRNTLLEKFKDKFNPEQVEKLVAQERLLQSGLLIGSESEKVFLKDLWERALAGGLSSEINILTEDGTKNAISRRSLATTMQELKYFLEQYADRVLADPATGKVSTETFEKLGLSKEAIITNMVGKPAESFGAKLKRYLPSIGGKLEDGLLPYTYKSRWFLTLLPLVITIGVSVSVSYINNWWTKRKHGGQVFFPGEGGPAAPGGGKVPNPAFASGTSRLMHSGSPFEQFQMQRQMLSAQGRQHA